MLKAESRSLLKDKTVETKYLLYILWGMAVLSVISLTISIRFFDYDFHANFFKGAINRFSDFFNSCRDASSSGVYTERHVIYPPLANYFYKIFSQIMSPAYLRTTGDVTNAYVNTSAMMSFTIYMVLITFFLTVAIYHSKTGSIPEKLAFSLFILISFPFLYAFERGNLVVVACILLIFFAANHDNKNKIVRELALISLAAAAAIKIYPAFALLLLVQQKRVKDAVKTAFYSSVLFIVPFFFMGGLTDMKVIVQNVSAFIHFRSGSPMITGSTSLQSFLAVLGEHAHIGWLTGISGIAISVLVMLIGAAAILFTSNVWKQWGLVFVLICNFPGANAGYMWVFAVLPLIFMLNQKRSQRFDIIYLLLFISVMIYYPWLSGAYYLKTLNITGYSINGRIICGVTNAIYFMLIFETFYKFIRKTIKNKRNARREATCPAIQNGAR